MSKAIRVKTEATQKLLKREPLAVVGIGCRLPGGLNSPGELWKGLLSGIDAICEVPEDRWKHSRFHDTNSEKYGAIRNAKGGFIEGVDQFDAEFFGYFPTEAQRIDPQQRLLLEVTHEAMEDAGIRRDQFDGSKTSVFIGSFMYDYLCMQASTEQRDEINSYVSMGTGLTSLANRISYNFNLKGPSISLDTACSSSLVAVHLACRSIWSGDAEMAIAGGVNLLLRPESSIMLSKSGFLNPDQYCKAFDIAANGYVRSEGCGVVILKPLDKAVADGDSIWAIVRGTLVNSDGFTPDGFTVPSVAAHVSLLKTVYTEAEVNPCDVSYVEAHGPGTSVGDPIETKALGTVFGHEREKGNKLLIGSVKTNLGHLEGAAGITGFIKGVLTAHHRVVAPNLHFHTPNPNIDFEGLKLQVPTVRTDLSDSSPKSETITIGVNSFGAGGTNAHAVLQSPRIEPKIPKLEAGGVAVKQKAVVYVISAENKLALSAVARQHADFLRHTTEDLKDLAYSAFTRRSHYSHLLAVVGESTGELAGKLHKFAEAQVDPQTLSAKVSHKRESKLGFLFSGQGGQWAQMGRGLLEREPVFKSTMQEIDALFRALSGWSLLGELEKDQDQSRIDDTIIVQPAIMAIQIALFQLYGHYGIRPIGIVGHSIGEVAAAFAAGALSLEEAVRVIYHRSQAQNQASGKGGMLAVGLSVEESQKLISPYEGRVSIGAVNGPEMVTLSGDFAPLEEISKLLETRGIFNRKVRVQVPYHSHHIQPIRDVMLSSLKGLQGRQSKIALYSTVTGKSADGTHLTAEYWFENARKSVLFTDALGAMIADGFDTFIEVGPHPVLVAGAEALFKKCNAECVIGPSMTRKEPEAVIFLQSLARLAARGATPDASALFGAHCHYVRLPKYVWQHSRHWFESPAAAEKRLGQFEHPFLKGKTQLDADDGLAVWKANLDVHKFPHLRDHQVDGEIVFPGTGHLEFAWAVAMEQFPHQPFFLEHIQFDKALLLAENSAHPLDVQLQITSNEGDYCICSRPPEAAADIAWSKHSSGRMNVALDLYEKSTVCLKDLKTKFESTDSIAVEIKAFYEALRNSGLNYGDKFRSINALLYHEHEMLAELTLPDELIYEARRNNIHPAILDACLHVIFAEMHQSGNLDRVYLPQSIDRVRFYKKPTQKLWSYVRATRYDGQYLCSDNLIFDDTGELVAEILGLTCKRLLGAGAQKADTLYEGCYEYEWSHAVPNVMPKAEGEGVVAQIHGRISDFKRAIILGDCSKIISQVAKNLSLENLDTPEKIETTIISLEDKALLEKQIAEIPLDRRTLIVFVPEISGSSNSVERFAWNGLSHCPCVPKLLELAQILQKREGVPRLCIVTQAAVSVEGDKTLNLGHSILHGMSRVIRNEIPNIPLTVIDLSAAVSPDEIKALNFDLLHIRRDQDESEVALRGEKRYVRKLKAINRESAENAVISLEAGVGGSYRAELRRLQALDEVLFRRFPVTAMGEREVEIAVEAAALNFKDIMNGMGLLAKNAVTGGLASERLGLEVSGRVVRIGSGVQSVGVGDPVIARVADGFSGRVTTPEHCVVKRPKMLSPQQGATIPLVYVTAYYSLNHLAHMAPGETLLIHSAAGGVGTAAIQLAKRAGLSIIATAGTQEKRDYLRKMGVQHVFDSRSLDFYNGVMRVTQGRGVDIILNSLSGRFIFQSIKCLAPFGRFIEIGKSDIYKNNKLNMKRLGENISYFVVDVDRLAAQRPEVHRQALIEVTALFENGELTPGEITEFPVTQLSDAFRCMTRALYRGKIVLNMQNHKVPTLPARKAGFHSDRSYLISGGASGFGLEVAKWMVDCGARHLVLLSRSGCKSESDKSVVLEMEKRGVRVHMAQVDVGDANAIHGLIQRIQKELPELAGVIHGAGIIDDAALSNQDMKRFERVFTPKAQGAWNLHAATLENHCKLDFFLMMSSISSVFGFQGQVNYSAANFFEDSLAEYRRQLGLRATSINLGVLGQYAGMSKKENDENDVIGILEGYGFPAMTLSDVIGKLESALIQRPSQRVTAQLDWTRFRKAYPQLARDSRFVDLIDDAALSKGVKKGGLGLACELQQLVPEKKAPRLQQELQIALSKILDLKPEQLDITATLDNLGLDSLMLTQFRNIILRLVDINLPMIKLLKGPSIETLSMELLAQLEAGSAAAGSLQNTESTAATTFTVADLPGVKILNPWLVRGCGNAMAPVRLLCFHSMGVGASLFTKFLLTPPEGYDILAVQTPGRENRASELAVESVDALADQIVLQLLPLLDRPFVVWGHSFGGITAFEVIRKLRERHKLEPEHFMVTGTMPPHLLSIWQNREVMLKASASEFSAEYLISLSRYVDDIEFLKQIIPSMRRDYPLMTSYRAQAPKPLSFPITAFAARQDDIVYPDEVREWAKHTLAAFKLIEVDGDHWFLTRNQALLTKTLSAIAASVETQQKSTPVKKAA